MNEQCKRAACTRREEQMRARIAELEGALREAKDTIKWMNGCSSPAQDCIDEAIAKIKEVLGGE